MMLSMLSHLAPVVEVGLCKNIFESFRVTPRLDSKLGRKARNAKCTCTVQITKVVVVVNCSETIQNSAQVERFHFGICTLLQRY